MHVPHRLYLKMDLDTVRSPIDSALANEVALFALNICAKLSANTSKLF